MHIHPEIIHTHPVKLNADKIKANRAKPKARELSSLVQIVTDNLYAGPINLDMKAETDDAGACVFIEGLPSVVIADGAFGSPSAPPQAICNELFSELAPRYIKRLSAGEEEPQAILAALLHEIDQRIRANYQGAQLTLAFALSFVDQKTGEQKVAAMGCGSDIIAIYRPEEQRYIAIKSAYNHIYQEDKPVIEQDGSKAIPHNKEFLPLRRNAVLQGDGTCVVMPLQEGDQLVCLSDGALDFLPLLITFEDIDGSDECRVKRDLSQELRFQPEDLYECCKQARKERTFQQCSGDDLLILSATIPSMETRKKIILKSHDRQIVSGDARASSSSSPHTLFAAQIASERTPLAPHKAPATNKRCGPCTIL